MSKDQSVDRSVVLTDEENDELFMKGFVVVCDERNNTQEDEDRYVTNVSLFVHPHSPLHPTFRERYVQSFLSSVEDEIDKRFGRAFTCSDHESCQYLKLVPTTVQVPQKTRYGEIMRDEPGRMVTRCTSPYPESCVFSDCPCYQKDSG